MPYDFTTDGYNAFSKAVLDANGDQATLTTILADMQGTVTDAIAKDVTQQNDLSRLNDENDRLKKANMDLFLRVGAQAKEQTGEPENNPEEPRSVSDIMNEYFEKTDKKGK